MANANGSAAHQADDILAQAERKLRQEHQEISADLNRIIRARDALGMRRGRRPKEVTTKG